MRTTVKTVQKSVEYEIQLVLTEAEAVALLTVCNSIGGIATHSKRYMFDQLGYILEKEGVEPNNNLIEGGVAASITFRDEE